MRDIGPGMDQGKRLRTAKVEIAKNKLVKAKRTEAATLRKSSIRTPKQGVHSMLTLDHAIWQGDSEKFLSALPNEPLFDLVVTSPPYNIGKSYEKKGSLEEYVAWQRRIIDLIVPRLKGDGSLCWQVGNFVDNGQIVPLDIEFAPIFKAHGLQMRNRIIWHFGMAYTHAAGFPVATRSCFGIRRRTDTFSTSTLSASLRSIPARRISRGRGKGWSPATRWARIPRTSGTSRMSRATMWRRRGTLVNSRWGSSRGSSCR